jgi:hypothetical protein
VPAAAHIEQFLDYGAASENARPRALRSAIKRHLRFAGGRITFPPVIRGFRVACPEAESNLA